MENCDAPTVERNAPFFEICILSLQSNKSDAHGMRARLKMKHFHDKWLDDDTRTWGSCTHYQFERVSLSHATIRFDCHAPKQIKSLSFVCVYVLFCAK